MQKCSCWPKAILIFNLVIQTPFQVAAAPRSSGTGSGSSENRVPTLATTSPLCDVGFMDDFYNEITGNACIHGALTEMSCYKANYADGMIMAAFAAGSSYAGIAVATVVGLFSTPKDGGIEAETDAQKLARRNFAANNISCEDRPNSRFLPTMLDYQISQGSDERPAPSDDHKMSDQEEKTYQTDLSWWCQPYYGPATNVYRGKKVYDFLKLNREERTKLLCQDKELRDYYERRMSDYVRKLHKETQVTGLACESTQSLKMRVTHKGKKYDLQVKHTKNGEPLDLFASLADLKQSPAYTAWAAFNEELRKRKAELAGTIAEDRIVPQEALEIPGQNGMTLKPGQFHFTFSQSSQGSTLSKIHLVNTSPVRSVVSEIDGTKLEALRTLGNKQPLLEVETLNKTYSMFLLRFKEAHKCCSEADNSKQVNCLKELDTEGLNPKNDKADVTGSATPRSPRAPPTAPVPVPNPRRGTQ